MRGLWNFILLGFIFQIGVELGLSRRLTEDENSFDAIQKLEEFEESREKDRVNRLNGAAGASEDVPEPGELFEGDIIMDESLRAAVLGKADKRTVVIGEGKLWPNATVPFEFDKRIDRASKKCVLRAIRTFRKHTCINFVKRTNEVDYLFISSRRNMSDFIAIYEELCAGYRTVFETLGRATFNLIRVCFPEECRCSSYVGKKGEKQDVSIGGGCTRLGTCQHELMHALGTIHEQSRPDRDAHVKIIWSNIREGEQSNFRKYRYSTVSDEGVDYDFMSVMHYPNHAFAKDRSYPTIISRSDPSLKFGQRVMFSRGDVQTINRLYECDKDKDIRELPEILSDEEVKERRDLRERFDLYE